MEFKKGDAIICIRADDGHVYFSLEYGKKYIATDVRKSDHMNIKEHPDEEYAKPLKKNAGYYKRRFIHEKDWIRRIKYGV